MSMKGPMTSPTPSRRWPPQLASWALMSMRSRRCGLAKRTSGLLTMWQKFPKGHPFLLGGASHWISHDHGLKGNPFPWGPEAARWSVLLPWCGKEGQNRGMVVNHMQMSQYDLSLIFGWCLEYFTTSTNAMHCHSSCVSWHQLASTMMTMTERRNPTSMIAARMTMTLHSARISTAPSTHAVRNLDAVTILP